MKNKTNYAEILLSDLDGKSMLKEMIFQKSLCLEELEETQKVFLESDAYSIVEPCIRPYFLKKVAGLRFGDEIIQIERNLKNMCFQLNKSENKIPEETEWEKIYQNATEDVRIEDIVSHFLGVREFRRNIKCPFHDEKTPSLKIYVNRNFFVCFGCDARGSPVDFVMKYKNCDFKEAVEVLSAF
jgi:hypothetical protein